MFNTKWQRTVVDTFTDSGVSLTETAGYATTKRRVEDLVLAGARLAEIRDYQYTGEIDELDPLVMPIYPPDLVDAASVMTLAKARIEKRKKLREAQLLEDADKRKAAADAAIENYLSTRKQVNQVADGVKNTGSVPVDPVSPVDS